jgi:acyl-CoA thioester hydrolase
MSDDLLHLTPIQVRFGDTDRFGHINNASFATYLESARIELITSLGYPLGGMILAHMAIDFRRQLQVGDPLVVFTRVERIGTSSVTMLQALVRPARPELGLGLPRAVPVSQAPAGEWVADARTVVVRFDYREDRSVPVSSDLRAQLAPFTGPLPASDALR